MEPHHGAGGTAGRGPLRDREDAVVARLATLAPHLDGEPDPEFRAATRARLVAMAAVRSPAPPATPLRRLLAGNGTAARTWRTRSTAAVAGAALTVTGLSGVVAAAADAGPGDLLYGVKRGTEQTRLALAGETRGVTLLGFASTRLQELEGALEQGAGAALVAATLATMDAQTVDGAALLAQRAVDTGTAATLDELDGWTAEQADGLAGLVPTLPGGAQDDAGDSAALLASIDERVEELRSALACGSGPSTSGADALGPVPVPCAGAPLGPGEDATTPVPDDPGAPGTPGSPGPDGESTGSGSAGAGEQDGDAGGDAGVDPAPRPATPGAPLPDLPGPELPSPELPSPELPASDLPGSGQPRGGPPKPAPTTIPAPDDPLGGTRGGSPTSSPEGSPRSGPVDVPRPDLCLEPLPLGDC